MDKLERYRKIICETLERHAAIPVYGMPDLNLQVLIDRERDHYQLLMLGWEGAYDYTFKVLFHFDIIDGKVWLQCNHTDSLIADELVASGVDTNDIILGFVPKESLNQPVSVSS